MESQLKNHLDRFQLLFLKNKSGYPVGHQDFSKKSYLTVEED
jgi:hypothetical protein